MNKAKTSYEIIKSLLTTEKATSLFEPNHKYLFLVDKLANKYQIKKAIEEIYNVKVKDVNTLVAPGKLKRVRYQLGKTADYKKAVVTLKEGERLEVS